MEVDLYNFDHGFSQEKDFQIGGYKIRVTSQHCDNLKVLPRRGKTAFICDENGNRAIERIEAVEGHAAVTATLIIDENSVTESKIYQSGEGKDSIHDFVLVLSFLTGRRVCIESELELADSKQYLDPVVSKNFFYNPLIDINKGLDKIASNNLGTVFYNLVHARTLYDLPAMCFYTSSVCEVLSTRVCKEKGYTKYPLKVSEHSIRNKVSAKLKSSVLERAKALVLRMLDAENYTDDILDDLVSRVSIPTSPSAIYKMEKFLAELKLFPEAPTKEDKKRLKHLNKARNSIVHTGDVLTMEGMSFSRRAEVTITITILLLSISELYFAKHIFEITDFLIQKEESEIKKYFISGEFRGGKVFEESYEDFISRVEKTWVEEGVI
ncbi:MAG: hypothetical protein HWE16_02575 [Gammaproteobacteria bacterium]|nr:hypothetical protein [Gammaproteobacteria bacterium]